MLRTPTGWPHSPRPPAIGARRSSALLLRGLLGPTGVALVLVAGAGLLLEAGAALAGAAVLPSPGVAGGLLLGLLPAVLELALPIAFLTGLVVALGRWHDDGTWIALRACGMGGHRLLRPATLCALAVALPLLLLSHGLAPAGRRAAASRLAQACSELTLPPGGFLPLGGATLFRPPSGGVVAAFGEGLLIAVEGGLTPRAGGVLLRLGPGEALPAGPGGPVLRFESAHIPLALGTATRRIELVERTDAELQALATRREAAGRDPGYARLILLKRSSMALAVLLLPGVALPLALRWGGRAMPVLGVALLLWSLVRLGDGLVAHLGAWSAAGLPLLGLAALSVTLWAGWRDR
ncbi:MAG: LptF/LptG family permease [Pseudomonadota bacterium]